MLLHVSRIHVLADASGLILMRSYSFSSVSDRRRIPASLRRLVAVMSRRSLCAGDEAPLGLLGFRCGTGL